MVMELRPMVERCNEVSSECVTICSETLEYCLQKGGAYAEGSHIQTLRDCIDLCRTDGELMVRGSGLTENTCSLSAEACGRCAEACEAFPDDPRMQACVEVCRQCATACEAVAAA